MILFHLLYAEAAVCILCRLINDQELTCYFDPIPAAAAGGRRWIKEDLKAAAAPVQGGTFGRSSRRP
jgi:hypothetical protein